MNFTKLINYFSSESTGQYKHLFEIPWAFEAWEFLRIHCI